MKHCQKPDRKGNGAQWAGRGLLSLEEFTVFLQWAAALSSSSRSSAGCGSMLEVSTSARELPRLRSRYSMAQAEPWLPRPWCRRSHWAFFLCQRWPNLWAHVGVPRLGPSVPGLTGVTYNGERLRVGGSRVLHLAVCNGGFASLLLCRHDDILVENGRRIMIN